MVNAVMVVAGIVSHVDRGMEDAALDGVDLGAMEVGMEAGVAMIDSAHMTTTTSVAIMATDLTDLTETDIAGDGEDDSCAQHWNDSNII